MGDKTIVCEWDIEGDFEYTPDDKPFDIKEYAKHVRDSTKDRIKSMEALDKAMVTWTENVLKDLENKDNENLQISPRGLGTPTIHASATGDRPKPQRPEEKD